MKAQMSSATTSAATATLSNLNLSSKNFSEELANLASLTNSSDNILENSTHALSTATANNTISISCDNHSSAAVDVDLSLVGPSSVDSAMGTECNGTSVESHTLNNQNEEPNSSFTNCNAIATSDSHHHHHHHQPASSASSTSSGNFSTSPSQQNVFESTAVSQSYLCTLLTNLENEISVTQQHLDDENDKRHKYKVALL
jgi:hypothetical protein